MVQKRWVLGTGCMLLILLLLAGFYAFAAEMGSKDDPMIALSYIDGELKPKMLSMVDDAIAEKSGQITDEMNTRYNAFAAELDQKIRDFEGSYTGDVTDQAFVDAVADAVIAKMGSSGQGASAGGAVDSYEKVVVPSGKTLTAGLGTEIVLRLGDAVCVASGSPGLIDLTSAKDLPGGSALEKSHLYLVTVEGRGLKASNEATILIRGTYTIT